MLSLTQISYRLYEQEKIFAFMQKHDIFLLETTPNILFRDASKSFDLNMEMIEMVQKYNLSIVSMQSLFYKMPELNIFGERSIRIKTLNYLKRLIKSSSEIGINIFVFGSPKNRFIRNMKYRTANKLAKSVFDDLATFANSYKSVICLEPLPFTFGCNFINNLEEVTAFVKEVNNVGLKVNLDTGSVLTNKDNVDNYYKDLTTYVGHIHISAPNLRPINLNNQFYRNFAVFLKKINYQKDISFEMLPRSENNIKKIFEVLILGKKIYGA